MNAQQLNTMNGVSEGLLRQSLNLSLKKVLGVIISGAPGSGKGTQCEKIKEKYGLIHISVGDLLRAEVNGGSEIGKRAKSYMDAGQLVPDEVVVDMVAERLSQKDVQEHGFLLDGFPRTAVQAEALKTKGIIPDVFLLVQVPDEALVERIVGRRMDPVDMTTSPVPFLGDGTHLQLQNIMGTSPEAVHGMMGQQQQSSFFADPSQSNGGFTPHY
eukprot:TRINITY_DN230_c0_g1_i3.p1 TRINITY_DN230_c0_g1~~TRINITY_DN230_c0_g1_i3.p1  ORF type:complete len:214 (+),score=51.28 TRINITY_DN230_c0_g1_i3:164-805(+)